MNYDNILPPTLLLFAQEAPPPSLPPEMDGALAAILAVIFAFLAFFLIAGLVINAVICFLLSKCYRSIPEPYRLMPPIQVWLLMIPCFPLVWNFFVYLKLADSFKSYFNAVGRYDVGDCGKAIGLAYSICVCCTLLPYAGVLSALAALVLMVIFLIRAFQLKAMIAEFPQTFAYPPGQPGKPTGFAGGPPYNPHAGPYQPPNAP